VIAIIDYEVNNLASVRNAFHAVGARVTVTADPVVIEQADGVVLPGIGAAAAGMERISARGLDEPLGRVVAAGRPLLAICLGMQLLFDCSEEGSTPCLGYLPGRVERLHGTIKVPQIGWNQVIGAPGMPLWAGMPSNPYFYFVHSYVCVPDDPAMVAAKTVYGEPFCSAVAHGAIWATQFHPERSGRLGLRLVRNFVEFCGVHRPH
jgi:glutamine amidotransferase